jgi:hypothetical protein
MWANTNSGIWSETNNWSGGIVADGTNNAADFGKIDIVDDVTSHLDSARVIGNLTFGALLGLWGDFLPPVARMCERSGAACC